MEYVINEMKKSGQLEFIFIHLLGQTFKQTQITEK